MLTFILCVILSTAVLTLVVVGRMKMKVSGLITGTLGLVLIVPSMHRAALGYLCIIFRSVTKGGGESDLVGVGEINAERQSSSKASDL